MGCCFIIRTGRYDNMQKLKKYEHILADHPEKDDYLKYIFDIIKNDSGRDRRLFNYIKYNLNKLPSQNLDQFKIGAVHFIIHKNIFKSSLENYVLRFGEKYGNILFNNFVDKCVSTLENFKKRYGDGWEVRWANFKDKSANFKLEHYIKKYGSDLGKIKYNERLKKTKEQNVFCYDYWLKLGYTEYEAREILSKQADTSSLNSVMLRLGPVLGYIRYQEIKTIRQYQNTLERYVADYGIDGGTEIYNNISSKKVCEYTTEKYLKTRKTFENIGRWTAKENLDDFKHYKLIVERFTKRSIKQLPPEKQKMLEKRGPTSKTKKQDEVVHVDHMISKFFGFHNNILPQIIGSVYNLDVIDASKNISKNTKNSIDIDELFNNYFKGANDGC